MVGGLALGVLEWAYGLGRARRARVRRLGTIPFLQHSEERKLVRSRVPDRRGLAHPRYPTREKPKRLTFLGDYGFLPRTTGRAVRTRGSNCRGGRSSWIKRSDWARGTAPMTRCSKANGRRGSCAASRKNPVSRNRHPQALRRLGGSGRFCRHRRARWLLLLGNTYYPVAGTRLDHAAFRAEQDVPRSGGSRGCKPEGDRTALRVGDRKLGPWVALPEVTKQGCLILPDPDRTGSSRFEQRLRGAQR